MISDADQERIRRMVKSMDYYLEMAELAKERGDLQACINHQQSAVKIGDDLLAAVGSDIRFMPIVENIINLMRSVK